MSIYKHVALVAVAVMAAGFVGAEQSFERSVGAGTVKIASQVPAQKKLAIVSVAEAKATLVDNKGRGDRDGGHKPGKHKYRWGRWSGIGNRGACFTYHQAQHAACVDSCVGNQDCVGSCNKDYTKFRSVCF
jgi:hypothetical protein